MYIKQEESNVDLDKPCPEHPSGVHMWGFHSNEMYCGQCGWRIPIARLTCEHCGGINKFFRDDLVPSSMGLVDVFECQHCNKLSSIQHTEIQ